MKQYKVTELDWKPHPAGMGGERALLKFDNGWAASILRGGPFYTQGGTYELAVIRDGTPHYENPVAEGDVRGRLTETELSDLLNQISAYSPDVEEVAKAYRALNA